MPPPRKMLKHFIKIRQLFQLATFLVSFCQVYVLYSSRFSHFFAFSPPGPRASLTFFLNYHASTYTSIYTPTDHLLRVCCLTITLSALLPRFMSRTLTNETQSVIMVIEGNYLLRIQKSSSINLIILLQSFLSVQTSNCVKTSFVHSFLFHMAHLSVWNAYGT